MALILRIDFCRSEIKIFVRKRKFKPPHERGFPIDEPVQGGNKRDGNKIRKGYFMNEFDTVAAISTAQGAGGIGVIRISGDSAVEIADKVFKSAGGKKLSELKGYTALYGKVYDGEQCIDEVVSLVFKAPHSYTGEDVVEISCHGGIFVTREVLRTVLKNGARLAEAGEFTKRAFLNGKTDLTEAESVMDIIGAKSRAAARAALSVREGALRERIDKVKEDILTRTAHLQAWADYPEEDIPEVSFEALENSIKESEKELNDLLNTYDVGQAVKEGIDTVIVGRPNVGKSTIMNLLAGCEKSIVTEIPGTTRDIIEETVVLGDVILRLSDTAGIRDTDNKVEQIGVSRAKEKIKNCGLVLAVFDNSSKLNDDDMELLEELKGTPCIAVVNKTDLEKELNDDIIKDYVKKIVYISAANNTGLESLTEAVTEICGAENFDPSQGILSNERQRDAVLNSLKSLKEAKEALEMGMTYDAVTVSLEDAISCILELTGERVSETVVDRVFHNFCVGK